MNARWLWLVLFVLAIGLFLADFAHCVPRLPARVATHFGAGGQADGWGTKEELVHAVLATAAMIAVVSLLMPMMVGLLPISLLNMPNADYWRAPERAATTKEILLHQVGWLSGATMLLGVGVLDSMLRANLQAPPIFGGVFLYLGLYFGYLVIWLVEMIWRFRLPKVV